MTVKQPIHVLLVVDGYFSLGPQDLDNRSFSVAELIAMLRSTPMIFLDTAHRDGDRLATISGKFNFATSVSDLSIYDQIWLLGYNGPNEASERSAKEPIGEDELHRIATFMQKGGGVLATGDHEGLGCYMCGRIPRSFQNFLTMASRLALCS
jgi:hypothetical protein